KHIPDILVKLQEALNRVDDWALSQKLTFNPKKSCVVVFTNKRSIDTDLLPKLQMNGQDIEYADTVTYLGVTLDSKLSWNSHILQRIKDCKKTMMYSKALVSRNWGITPERIWWIWQSIVRPKLSYCSVAWAEPTIINKFQEKLRTLQRLALSMMTYCQKSTPSKSLEIILCAQPLHLFLRETAIRSRIRTKDKVISTWSGKTTREKRVGHLLSLDREIQEIIPEIIISDITYIELVCQIHFDVTGSITNSTNTYNIYTDGSKMESNDTGAGWAVTFNNSLIFSESTYLGVRSTVYDAEIFSIISACRFMLDRLVNIKHIQNIDIFSDSLSTILSVKKLETTSKLISECKALLNKLNQYYKVTLRWIKGHNDHCGNELADMLAKLGTVPHPIIEPGLPIGQSAIKNIVKDYFNVRWQKQWEEEPEKYRDTRSFIRIINCDKEYYKKIRKLDKSSLHQLVMALSGHGNLKKKLYDKKEIDDPFCRLCNTEYETPFHILYQCDGLEAKRLQIINGHKHAIDTSIINYKSRKRKWDITYKRVDPTFIDLSLKLIAEFDFIFG
ncbi:MAG: hypothetical protein KAG56_11035, partial [Sulfurovaceae bacterium]|nr:hypothetical protein [Sulfurovaceae bacterium]